MTRHHLSGSRFTTGSVTFTVVDAETYAKPRVSNRYREILAFKPGFLVAVSHRGTCIPNITGTNGVARLTAVEVDGKIFNRPGAISQALGVDTPMKPYALRELPSK